MSRKSQSPLAGTIAELRRLLARLESYAARGPLDLQIEQVLTDLGAASTNTIAALVHRRRSDVLYAVRLMRDAGRVIQVDRRWQLNENGESR